MLCAIPMPLRSVFHWTGRFSLTRRMAMARTRAHLAQLEDHMLDDIGLTREDAAHEAARRAWDAPGHWLR